jgi:hypothetical protein
MKCDHCGREVKEADSDTQFCQTLCEDFFLDIKLKVKGCDPWAVCSSTRLRENSGVVGAEDLNE